MRIAKFGLASALVGLAGCGGSGGGTSGATALLNVYVAEAQALGRRTDNLPAIPASALPNSGSATYDGIAIVVVGERAATGPTLTEDDFKAVLVTLV